MTERPQCPFYGKEMQLCDVGCTGLSPYDVALIVRYCSQRHTECPTYRMLSVANGPATTREYASFC